MAMGDPACAAGFCFFAIQYFLWCFLVNYFSFLFFCNTRSAPAASKQASNSPFFRLLERAAEESIPLGERSFPWVCFFVEVGLGCQTRTHNKTRQDSSSRRRVGDAAATAAAAAVGAAAAATGKHKKRPNTHTDKKAKGGGRREQRRRRGRREPLGPLLLRQQHHHHHHHSGAIINQRRISKTTPPKNAPSDIICHTAFVCPQSLSWERPKRNDNRGREGEEESTPKRTTGRGREEGSNGGPP